MLLWNLWSDHHLNYGSRRTSSDCWRITTKAESATYGMENQQNSFFRRVVCFPHRRNILHNNVRTVTYRGQHHEMYQKKDILILNGHPTPLLKSPLPRVMLVQTLFQKYGLQELAFPLVRSVPMSKVE